ncbi:hypothetical protein [Ramlibacter albus]|uniref:hypothetical protein n=1 Tax=Ramlibacter albus TaxID=2079448 RepID=UPI001C9AF81C|nr:hypothetical protein [Ramlibacter albus]
MALISCPECNKTVSDKATACVHCGNPLKTSEDSPALPAPPASAVPVRQGVAQAVENRAGSSLWGFQVFIAACIAGYLASSWWVFGGVFVGLAVLANIPYLGKLVGFAMAVAFGVLVYYVCKELGSPEAGYVIGGIVFLGFLAANMAMSRHLGDLKASKADQ